ncbi:MAG: hypothetical protein BGN92_06685 [Sphingobacteriales bacterium 41-5]|nr:MAG: hypothetical protein BGN92_06685 [Sphingobacteriales bacterium 41-5]
MPDASMPKPGLQMCSNALKCPGLRKYNGADGADAIAKTKADAGTPKFVRPTHSNVSMFCN